MRLAVLSDIHGNLPALQAVLSDLNASPVDGYLLAGDYFACPFGPETTRLISDLPGWKIYGNGELYFRHGQAGTHPPAWSTAKQFELFRWQLPRITGEEWDFIHSLPEQQIIHLPGTAPIRMVHGSHRSPFEQVFPDQPESVLQQIWKDTGEAVFICGHTHESWMVERDGRLALNPGAVCGPLDGYVGAEYAVIEWTGGYWQAELRRVRYDISQVRQAFIDSGLMQAARTFSRLLICAIETGQDIPKQFLEYAKNLSREMGFDEQSSIPDEAWDEAGRSFAWPVAGINRV